MEVILVLIVTILVIYYLVKLNDKSDTQQQLLESLNSQLKQLTNEVVRLRQQEKETKPALPPVEPVKPVVPEVKKEIVPNPVIIHTEPVIPPVTGSTKEESLTLPELLRQKPVLPEKEKTRPVYQPAFITKDNPANTDLEKFIGENIANKIGIAVLVLGIGFFIKYAIDKDWIHEAGRVIIGLISGGILIGLAHYFRNSYRSFSSVLVGGGLSVFYFSIAFAFHQYHLISQTTAFIIMVIISGLGVLLSLYYNRQELAILATIGGFITPFLVSTGENNYTALFTYLTILNTGLMVLAWFKRWPAINTIALLFTTLIYGSWLTDLLLFGDEPVPKADALLFASIFYLLFMAMHVINTIRLKTTFTGFDFMLLLSTNALYYLAGMLILDPGEGYNYKGLFTALTGLFNLALAFVFYHKKSTDRNFVSLLIGLSVSFLSLAAPVQLNGNQITLFWAAEMLVLYWLYLRSGISLLKSGSALICLLMLASLLHTWQLVYLFSKDLMPVILNKGFITTVAAAAALLLYYVLIKRDRNELFFKSVSNRAVGNTVLKAGIASAYLAGILEIGFQFSLRNPGVSASTIHWQCYTYLFVLILLQVFSNHKSAALLRLVLTLYSLGIYIIGLPSVQTYSLYLAKNNQGIWFTAHWVAVLLLLWLLYRLIRLLFAAENTSWKMYRDTAAWLSAAASILVLSVEMYQLIFHSHYGYTDDQSWWENLYYKAGLSILWGLCSFAMMWLGMKKDFKPLRVISLTLFSVTIIKLFLYDIVNIPPGGKIAAFILLGVLLLAVSFMYQRLKKIILDNKREE